MCMMDRLAREKLEFNKLSPFATKSSQSKGRIREEERCILRTDFQRDRDRILPVKLLGG